MTLIQLKHIKIPLGNRQSDAIIASSDFLKGAAMAVKPCARSKPNTRLLRMAMA